MTDMNNNNKKKNFITPISKKVYGCRCTCETI